MTPVKPPSLPPSLPTPDDIKAAAPAVLRHRLILTPEAQVAAETPDRVLMRALAQVEVPR